MCQHNAIFVTIPNTLLSTWFCFYFRWSVAFKQTNREDIGDPPPLDIINNYFSIGVVGLPHVLQQTYVEFVSLIVGDPNWDAKAWSLFSTSCKTLFTIPILLITELARFFSYLGHGPRNFKDLVLSPRQLRDMGQGVG